ncbi:MAG: cyclase, partial [Microvirga sp.]|nr:cyclase [Microvirga sp.]
VARCVAVADRSAVCLEDFAPYAPSRGAPIAFMAAPVIDQGIVVGVLIAQLSNEEIDNVVTGGRRWRQEGFGATGEAYLVGPDYLVRSGPRAFYENRYDYFAELKAGGAAPGEIGAIQRYETPVLHQRVDTRATRAALAGIEGTGEIVGYRDIPTLASWVPLAIPGLKWALVAKIDAAEAFAPIYQLRRDLLIVGGLALLVVAVTAAWLSRALLGPLRELTAGVKRFAAGDYEAAVPVRTRDEVGQPAIGVTSCLRAGLQHPTSSQAGGTSGDLAKHAAAAASFDLAASVSPRRDVESCSMRTSFEAGF